MAVTVDKIGTGELGFLTNPKNERVPVHTSEWAVILNDVERTVRVTLASGRSKDAKAEDGASVDSLKIKKQFATTLVQIIFNDEVLTDPCQLQVMGNTYEISQKGFFPLGKNLNVTPRKIDQAWSKHVQKYLITKLTPTAEDQLLDGAAAAERRPSLTRTDSMESNLDQLGVLDISDDETDQELASIDERDEGLAPPPPGTPPPPSRSPSPAEQAGTAAAADAAAPPKTAGPADAPKPKEETPKKGSLIGRVTKFVIGKAGKSIGMLLPKKVFSCSKTTWLSIGAAVAVIASFSFAGRLAAQYSSYSPWTK